MESSTFNQYATLAVLEICTNLDMEQLLIKIHEL